MARTRRHGSDDGRRDEEDGGEGRDSAAVDGGDNDGEGEGTKTRTEDEDIKVVNRDKTIAPSATLLLYAAAFNVTLAVDG